MVVECFCGLRFARLYEAVHIESHVSLLPTTLRNSPTMLPSDCKPFARDRACTFKHACNILKYAMSNVKMSTASRRAKKAVPVVRNYGLSDVERKYPVHECELFAIILSLRKWHHLLFGSEFQVLCKSNHRPFKCCQCQKKTPNKIE